MIEYLDQDQGKDVRYRESPPDTIQAEQPGEQESDRNQNHQLTADGIDHTVDGVAGCLQGGTRRHGEACGDKADADNPEGRDSDIEHVRRGIEQQQQFARNNPEQQCADRHQHHGDDPAVDNGFLDPQPVPCSQIIGDNGYHRVVQAEDRVEDHAVQLEKHAEHRGSGGGKRHQDLIHAESHDRSDGHHNDRGNADPVDLPDQAAVQPEALHAQADLFVFPDVQYKGQDGGQRLSADGCRRGAGDAHLWEAEIAENQNRIHDEVENSTGGLGNHRIRGFSG